MAASETASVTSSEHPIVVAALYKFTKLEDFAQYQAPLQRVCEEAEVYGTILLAHEGVNGTVSGSRTGIDKVLGYIRTIPGCDELEIKESHADEMPFYRMKVRLKKEIVTMGVPDIDPNQSVGTYVDPQDWNELISDPDVIVIDTRNDYEVGIGTFKGAIDPKTTAFREFPDWFRNQEDLRAQIDSGKKVAMFCTGGIRCEKSTAFLKKEGVEEVFHLKGGILKYLENIPKEESLWEGDCFVFDQRVSVKHGLELGDYDMCHACRNPIDADDMASEKYVPGVSCPKCYGVNDEAREKRLRDRQKQIELARQRGEAHIGSLPLEQRKKVPKDE